MFMKFKLSTIAFVSALFLSKLLFAEGPATSSAILKPFVDKHELAGAVALVMPCNTAHFWYADLTKGCRVPFLSIVDASVNELSKLADARSTIGIIATRATLAAQIFDPALSRSGFTVMVPDETVMNTLVLPGIECVKAGDTLRGGQLIEEAVQTLLNHGAHAVILACTETPLALDAIKSKLRIHCVDSTAALARCCVAWWQAEFGANAGAEADCIIDSLPKITT